MSQSTIALLKKLAIKQTLYERNSEIAGACGGNYDDAFDLGYDNGEITLARQILELEGIAYV